MQQQDVNFDGYDDLVFLTALGASNGFFEFYVWDDGQYVLAGRNALNEDGLPNYTLDPGRGYVVSYHQMGWAGLLNEQHIFRWEGNRLKLVRYAVCEENKQLIFEENSYIEITDYDRIRARVFECCYTEGERTDTVIYETVVEHETVDARALLDQIDAALWNGLK